MKTRKFAFQIIWPLSSNMAWLKSPQVDHLPNLISTYSQLILQEKTCCNSDQTLFDTTALFKSIIVSCYKTLFHNVNRTLIRILPPLAEKFTCHLLFLVRKNYTAFSPFFPSLMFQCLTSCWSPLVFWNIHLSIYFKLN